MAVEWKADLTIIQLSNSVVSVTVTRTDDDIEHPSVWNFTLEKIGRASCRERV